MPKKTTPTQIDPQRVKQSVGYIRVSTLEQADESLSLNRQEEAVKTAGATLVFQDIDSGSKDERKELQKLMQLVRDGEIKEVVVPRIDRLTRSLRQLLDLISEFEKLGVNLKILDLNLDLSTPMGKFMVHLIGMFAEWETDQLSERIKAERRQRRQKKLPSASYPFGYKVEQDQYVLDHTEFLCLLTDRPENYPSGEAADRVVPIPGRTVYQLCRELVELFLEEGLPRSALGQFFEKYGVEKPSPQSKGVRKRLFWTPSGFLSWVTNPVLQGHTVYLRQITVKKREREMNPDGPQIVEDTHPSQRLLSNEEAKEITRIIQINRRLGGANFETDPNRPDQYREFAYQSKHVFCANCGSLCTSKTSSKDKYQYFGCRYTGVGCNNKKSVEKYKIEQALIQRLVMKSREMREAAWEAKRGAVSGFATFLQASGADEQVVHQYLASSAPTYEDLDGSVSLPPEQRSRIQELEESLQDLENMRRFRPEIEQLKQQLQRELEEAKNSNQSLLDRSAGSIIFEGNTSYFWDGLTNDDKAKVYPRLVHKIFIGNGQVTEILLKTEQSEENYVDSETTGIVPEDCDHCIE
jgi:site-specific DNA recombinase